MQKTHRCVIIDYGFFAAYQIMKMLTYTRGKKCQKRIDLKRSRRNRYANAVNKRKKNARNVKLPETDKASPLKNC